MQHPLLKKIAPHLGALLVFLMVAALFCRPALEGYQLNQHDNVSWKGMAQNAFEYKEANGHFPLWNPNLFGGMPNYQIAMEGKSILPEMAKVLSLGLPKPMNFFFLACVFFYILALTLGASPVIATLVALGYSLSTYNPVIIAAGHDTQMIATACMPLLLAGLLLTYRKHYWTGLSITTFGAYLLIAANHLQITYYFFLIALVITISYAIYWIQQKDWKHLFTAAGITLSAAVLAIAGNALILLTAAEYSSYTMRGGKDVSIEGDQIKVATTKGLDTSYAFEYSLGNTETFTLLMPNAFGGGHSRNVKEGSAVARQLMEKGLDETNAEQLAQSLPQYWGALPYTAGPAYLGILIFVLGLLGFVLSRGPLRAGLIAVALLGIFISWGKNFAGFNLFLFEYLPLFNKFRAPSMAQAIPQLAFGVSAVLALQILVAEKDALAVLTSKKVVYTLAALFGVLFILWLFQSYSAPIDQQILAGYTDKNGSDEFARAIVAGLHAERKSMFGTQLLRALLLSGLVLGTLWLQAKKIIRPLVAGGLLLVLSTVELGMASYEYLGAEAYMNPDEYSNSNFAPSSLDQQILQDKDPNYRVLNLSTSTFNDAKTSYHHKSVGGYHAAKLRIYQDLIEKYFAGNLNTRVLNMLNTRYIIVGDPSTNEPSLINNRDSAYGNCWFVRHVKVVKDRATALQSLGTTSLKDTAIIEKELAKTIIQPSADSNSLIRMTRFSPDTIEYEAYCAGPEFAVFSEIYYPKGWNAYVNDQQVDYQNVNYVLRGLSLPAGQHKIRFVFEPASYKNGVSIMYASSFLIVLITLGGLVMAWKKKLESTTKA
jgi:Bacterial membrane protein YfhO